jgi:serine protease inhibitor
MVIEMRRTSWLALPLLLAACELPSGNHIAARDRAPVEVSAQAAAIADATNGFGFDFIVELVAQHPEKNVFVSPTSIASSLTMAYLGAQGDTERQMAGVLQIDSLSRSEIENGYRDLLNLTGSPGRGIELSMANSIWVNRGTELVPDFVTQTRNHFGAHVATADFSDPGTLKAINKWVHAETRGQIPAVIDRIHPAAVTYLVNAVHFRAPWTSPFAKRATREADFKVSETETKRVMMMSQKGIFHFRKSDAFEAVRLDYGDGRYGMIAFLPAEGSSVDDLARTLAAAPWQDVVGELKEEHVEVALPRFKLESKFELKPPLSALGMPKAFDQRGADFGQMVKGGGIWIEEVFHRAVVEVDEEGTRAAAATATETVGSIPPRFKADRPFLFVIQDSETNAILFIGVVRDPTLG